MALGDSFIEKIKAMGEISVDGAVSLTGSVGAYEKIVSISAKMLPEAVKRLDELKDEDLSLYSIEAHGIKGVLRSIGAKRLSDLAFELEEVSKKAQINAFAEKHAAFCRDIGDFLERLLSVCETGAPQRTERGSFSFLKSRLPALKAAVLNYDQAGAAEEISVLNQKYYNEAIGAALDNALTALEYFDYDKAAEIIAALEEVLGG